MILSQHFSNDFSFLELQDANKFKEMAKVLCKNEHYYLLEQDRIKQAAKQSTVDAFDEVKLFFFF